MHLIADDDNNADLRTIMEEDICVVVVVQLLFLLSVIIVQGRISSLCTVVSIEFVGLDVVLLLFCGGGVVCCVWSMVYMVPCLREV